MFFAKDRPVDANGAQQMGLSKYEPRLVEVEQGQVVERRGDIGVIGAERLLIDRDAPLVERLGVRVAALGPVELGQVRGSVDACEDATGMARSFFGDSANKPGNIAGLVVVITLLLAFLLYFIPSASPLVDKLIAVTTLALGYLFGKSH
jgi:hypothetical protein